MGAKELRCAKKLPSLRSNGEDSGEVPFHANPNKQRTIMRQSIQSTLPMRRLAVLLSLALSAPAVAQEPASNRIAHGIENRIDVVTPLAPELAAYGAYSVGVRTITVTDSNRADVLRTKTGEPTVRAERSLTLEVWYPANAADSTRDGEYRAIMRDPSVVMTLRGRAHRDAAPIASDSAFPLLIISHGYPGNRFLLSHLGENLASKGYIVVSIDHTGSTYDQAQTFAVTLYNRSYDQLFVLNELARLGATNSGHFLAGRVDATRTGIVG